MRTMEEVLKIAEENGWVVNPNSKIAESVLRALNRMYERYEVYFCPCKPALANKKDENGEYLTKCPCKNAQNEINEDGHCHCNLFFKSKP